MKRLSTIDLGNSQSADINMSPLVDMVFLLLIFFMVTTVFVRETGVEVTKPTAATAEELDRRCILIAVTPEGKIVHGGAEIGINRVRGIVSRLLAGRNMPVIILADEGSRTGIVVRVIDQCKLAGADRVSIAATRE